MGQREEHGGAPAEAGEARHAPGVRPGQGVQRPADSNVALQGERHDGQHAGVRRSEV